MTGNKRRHAASKICLILDKEACGHRRLEKVLCQALRGGVDWVQYRDKVSASWEMIPEAKRLLALTRRRRIPLIINDRLDVALSVKPDGVHLGQSDAPVPLARRLLGKKAIIGLSCHTAAEIKRARRLDVDYLGFGPVFASRTKPGGKEKGVAALQKAVRLSRKPVFAIGGITPERLTALRGIDGLNIAVGRAVCRAKDPAQAVRRLKMRLTRVRTSVMR